MLLKRMGESKDDDDEEVRHCRLHILLASGARIRRIRGKSELNIKGDSEQTELNNNNDIACQLLL